MPPRMFSRALAARAVGTQRPHVDHHTVALAGRPDLARACLAVQRRAHERAERPPQLPGQSILEPLALAEAGGVAEALERLAGALHEAKVAVEDDDERLRQLAQRGLGRAIGARPERVHRRLSRE